MFQSCATYVLSKVRSVIVMTFKQLKERSIILKFKKGQVYFQQTLRKGSVVFPKSKKKNIFLR